MTASFLRSFGICRGDATGQSIGLCRNYQENYSFPPTSSTFGTQVHLRILFHSFLWNSLGERGPMAPIVFPSPILFHTCQKFLSFDLPADPLCPIAISQPGCAPPTDRSFRTNLPRCRSPLVPFPPRKRGGMEEGEEKRMRNGEKKLHECCTRILRKRHVDTCVREIISSLSTFAPSIWQ